VLDATRLLRPGLLDGVTIVLAYSALAERPFSSAIGAACEGLGARVCGCRLPAGAAPGDDRTAPAQDPVEAAVERTLAEAGAPHMLVVDGASLFLIRGRGGEGVPEQARSALRECLEASWSVTQALAKHALLTDGTREGAGGRIVFLAPPSRAGVSSSQEEGEHEHTDAARAGLENLARTLSIEWARHAITTVAIAPRIGAQAAGEVAALTAYLASPAGAYFSGCLLDLTGPAST